MEVQLQELIDQIRKEGVETGEAQAKAIVDAANAEAEQILADAQAKADQMIADAKAETARMTKSGEDAIRQAGRNLLISFRESVSRELELIMKEHVSAAYSGESLVQLIGHIVEQWAEQPDAEDLTVLLSSEDLTALEENLLAALKEKLLTGVTLKVNDNIDAGFRIAQKDGGVCYDYSADTVVDLLSGYLSPRVAELLREAK